MKNILLIGVGGTGSSAVDIFFEKQKELGNQAGNNVTALVFDTDAGDLQKITSARTVVMADNASVGTICDRFGVEFLKEWFPCDDKAVRSQEMLRGASQWRKKSYLAFLNLMNKPLARQTFISALEDMSKDPASSCEVYIIASVAGGTGSGSFIPIALYAKRYLRKTLGKDPIVNAMIALPDIYADSQTPENRIKVYSNAYAILRELNAINLVARNYNAGLAEHKKAPIRFRIGDPNEPSVGLLFDASDKRFWTPEAAPFSQVFLLDRIPRINSVAAHNIVLANSLYTILCTDIGAAFDSEFSNHELLRSQSNGSNAIYAGISTAQIHFPTESVLDYLAHKKTLDSCNSEWLTLHKAVENSIKEKEQAAKALKRRYTMKDGEYAKILIDELEKLEDNNNDDILSLLDRGVYTYDAEGKKVSYGTVTAYAKRIEAYISGKIDSNEPIKAEIKDKAKDSIEDGKVELEAISSLSKELKDIIFKYYMDCLESIKRTSASAADTIITLDKKKEDFVGKDYSIVNNILTKNDKHLHPVVAMIQLCYLRKLISKKIAENNDKEWAELRQRNVEEIPDQFLVLPVEKSNVDEEIRGLIKGGKSAYLELGEERFKEAEDEFDVDKKRTNTKTDLGYMWQDAYTIVNKIYSGSQKQLRSKVYHAVAENIDILIAKYRNFFNRFEKEKEDLEEQTKTALRRDAGNVDSVINVYSSMEDKAHIYKDIIEDGGPVTDEEIARTDDIVGSGVYKTVYNSAAHEVAGDDSWNDKDSGAYRSLFGNMVKAYRESIKKSEAFEKVASYNAIEAIVQKSGGKFSDKAVNETLTSAFSVAQELAKPSLRLDANGSDHDLVQPSEIMVFMMSENTGRYIKKHADEFDLTMPADQTKEKNVIRVCAEEFIHKYSGNNSARVSIVKTMPDNILYCTGEIMDITPLRISKFNELGEDNLYFKNYSLAIENYKKYGTDMWNPHLGNNLHKRGYLPYMNEEKEKDCDVKVAKALLYGFQKGHLTYKSGSGEFNNMYNFYCNGKKITDSEGKWINRKNAAQIISWLRNEDEMVEEWSDLFDKDIQRQMNLLPSLASDNINEIRNLESLLTKTPFMRMLNEKLYTDDSAEVKRVGSSGLVKREGPTAIEFAYLVKTSEELGRDCDDAERLLKVLYDEFKDICAYRTNPSLNPERFIQVYRQQLGNFYEAVATSKTVFEAGAECDAHFTQFISWFNEADVFNTISADNPMDDNNNVCINTVFDYNQSADVKRILGIIKNGTKNLKMEENVAEDAPENAETPAEAEVVKAPAKAAKGKKGKAAEVVVEEPVAEEVPAEEPAPEAEEAQAEEAKTE